MADTSIGNGGDVDIATQFLILSADSSITSNALTEMGIPGTISILGPELDLTGSLSALNAKLLEGESQLPEHCAVRLAGNQSSFIQTGKGGLSWTADVWQPSFEGDNTDDEN